MPLLDCQLTAVYKRTNQGVFDVNLSVEQGEIVGVAGESGSGKSTIASSIMGTLARRGGQARGRVLFGGRDLLKLSERELRHIRGREIALVAQSSLSALNPALKLRTQFQEIWRAHRKEGDWRDSALPTLELLRVPATPHFFERYGSELSVGLAQRVLVALALLHNPSLLIADEPTSALDLATQAQLLGLFRRLRDERGMSILFISHDLIGLASLCDRVAVLRQGSVIETLDGKRLLTSPAHAYTRELVAALRSIAGDFVSPAPDGKDSLEISIPSLQ